MKISIIMPVYNSEKYLEATLSSILEQTYSNWELIIIDDCSNDNSFNIIKRIAKSDSRIKVYQNKKNLGICGNRNRGLEYATGDYIVFCDDDDLFETNLLKDNVEILLQNPKVDMIKFGRKLVCVDSNDKEFSSISTYMDVVGELTSRTKYSKYFLVRKSDVLYNLWNGFYRRSLIEENHIKFDEDMKFGSEDADFSYSFYLKSQVIYLNPKVYYNHYKRNASSTSRKFNVNKIFSIIKTAQHEFQIWEHINFNDIHNQYYRIVSTNININNIMLNQIFHFQSDMNYQERKSMYKVLYQQLLSDRYIVNFQIIKMLWQYNKKHFFVTLCLSTKMYWFIDLFYRISAKIKNRKWN